MVCYFNTFFSAMESIEAWLGDEGVSINKILVFKRHF